MHFLCCLLCWLSISLNVIITIIVISRSFSNGSSGSIFPTPRGHKRLRCSPSCELTRETVSTQEREKVWKYSYTDFAVHWIRTELRGRLCSMVGSDGKITGWVLFRTFIKNDSFALTLYGTILSAFTSVALLKSAFNGRMMMSSFWKRLSTAHQQLNEELARVYCIISIIIL